MTESEGPMRLANVELAAVLADRVRRAAARQDMDPKEYVFLNVALLTSAFLDIDDVHADELLADFPGPFVWPYVQFIAQREGVASEDVWTWLIELSVDMHEWGEATPKQRRGRTPPSESVTARHLRLTPAEAEAIVEEWNEDEDELEPTMTVPEITEALLRIKNESWKIAQECRAWGLRLKDRTPGDRPRAAALLQADRVLCDNASEISNLVAVLGCFLPAEKEKGLVSFLFGDSFIDDVLALWSDEDDEPAAPGAKRAEDEPVPTMDG